MAHVADPRALSLSWASIQHGCGHARPCHLHFVIAEIASSIAVSLAA